MPEIDSSITIMGVIAICAIVSPIAVAIINNHYLIKTKQLEINLNGKAKAFENYLVAVGKILDVHSSNSVCDYEACKCMAYAYAPKKAWSEMDKLDRLIKERKFTEAREIMAAVGKKLSNASK